VRERLARGHSNRIRSNHIQSDVGQASRLSPPAGKLLNRERRLPRCREDPLKREICEIETGTTPVLQDHSDRKNPQLAIHPDGDGRAASLVGITFDPCSLQARVGWQDRRAGLEHRNSS